MSEIENASDLSIAKLFLYQKGLYVPDELYDILNDSAYSGYRTTSGIFIKLGATLSREEFESMQEDPLQMLVFHRDFRSMSYEDYLKQREYVTTQIFRESELQQKDDEGNSFFHLKVKDDGKFAIYGQVPNSTGVLLL